MNSATTLLISRGTMSGGQAIGDCLAEHEGIRCVTREHLLAVVNRYGELATRVTERLEKAAEAYEQFSELRRPYQILMKNALLQCLREEQLAYFGYSGHLLLGRIRHVVRVRLIAPMDLRVARARELLGYGEAEAREYVRRKDLERTRWARWMYGVDIRDPALYDVCFNIERMSPRGTCRLLRDLTRHDDFQPTPESIEQVANDHMATQALAMLVTDARTMQYELGAAFAAGVLRLTGPYLGEGDLCTVQSVAGSVAGIDRIEYEPGYVPAYSMCSD